MAAETVTDDKFEAEVLKADKPVLVDFYADWCGPCKSMAPLIDELASEKGEDVKIVKVNIDNSPEAPTKYGVRGIPTFILFKDGEAVDQRVGGMSKAQLTEWVEQNTA